MKLEQTILRLPSVRDFIDDIYDAAQTKSVLVLIPDTISRDMVTRLVSNKFFDMGWDWKDIPYSSESLPAILLSYQLNISWPSHSTIRSVRNLLRCEGLPGLVHIRDFSTSAVENSSVRTRWLGLIDEWVRESRELEKQRVGAISKLCLIAKLRDFDFNPPLEQDGLSIHWWWGFPSSLEMRLACRIANQDADPGEAGNKWREQVLPALVGSDFNLAEHLWDDILGPTENVIQSLEEYARHNGLRDPFEIENYELDVSASASSPPPDIWERWSNGSILFTPEYGAEYHPAVLANFGNRIDVDQRLWRGQSELLLPMLNGIRIDVCDEMTRAFGEDWPISPHRPRTNYELEAVEDNPWGAEFGHIEYLLRNIPDFRVKSDLLELVSLGRNLRNEIAHYHPVRFADFEQVLRDMEELGFNMAR